MDFSEICLVKKFPPFPLLTFFYRELLKIQARQMKRFQHTNTGKEVNVMGELMESVVAVMGLAAGLMVALTTLLQGEVPEQNESQYDPCTIRPQTERMAA
jgi:hypothetical protein